MKDLATRSQSWREFPPKKTKPKLLTEKAFFLLSHSNCFLGSPRCFEVSSSQSCCASIQRKGIGPRGFTSAKSERRSQTRGLGEEKKRKRFPKGIVSWCLRQLVTQRHEAEFFSSRAIALLRVQQLLLGLSIKISAISSFSDPNGGFSRADRVAS